MPSPRIQGLVVQSLAFDRAQFAPSTARAWATEHGYRGGPLGARGPVYVVVQSPRARFTGTLHTVSLDQGVVATVGTLRSAREDPGPSTPSPADVAREARRDLRAAMRTATRAVASAAGSVRAVARRVRKSTRGTRTSRKS